jgi:guanylate kinase
MLCFTLCQKKGWKNQPPGRGTETAESLEKRLDLAVKDTEYGKQEGNFDIIVVNDNLDEAYAGFLAFLKDRYPSLQ